MGKVILNVDDGMVTGIDNSSDAQLSLDGVIAFCLASMEGACNDILEKNPEQAIDLYESMDALFYTFMKRTFPDIQPRDFELSDAAVLYAQDMIIEKAEKEGIPFEKALKKYEEEAKAYVIQKGNVS